MWVFSFFFFFPFNFVLLKCNSGIVKGFSFLDKLVLSMLQTRIKFKLIIRMNLEYF